MKAIDVSTIHKIMSFNEFKATKVFDSMDEYTLQQYLNVFLQQYKIKFSDLIELTKKIGQDKLIKDLTPEEKQLIDSYIK
jgi:hypothetical protein